MFAPFCNVTIYNKRTYRGLLSKDQSGDCVRFMAAAAIKQTVKQLFFTPLISQKK